jgi:methylmalonyl-CoA mutase N-terminal domain/subunit
MQDEARAYFEQIQQLGGMIAALESGFFRREIAEASFAYQREVEAGRKIVVGVNAFQEPDDTPIELLRIDDAVEEEQVTALRQVKEKRSQDDVRRTLDEVRRAASGSGNLMPPLLNAARARATVGEVMNALADVFGRYDGAAKW